MKILLGLFFAFVLFSCGGSSIFSGSQLPENPEKIIITWYESDDMLPDGQVIYISEDSCYYSSWKDQAERRIHFTMTKEEIKSLYNVFLEHDFDKIEIREEREVYDRGGSSASVSADNKNFSKTNARMFFVAENDWDNLGVIENAIYNITIQKIEKYRMNTTVKLSDELIKSGLILNLSINNDFIFDSSKDSMKTDFIHLVYPGENQFVMTLSDPDSISHYGYPTVLKTVWFVKSISDTSNIVVFDYVDGVLVGR